MKKTIAIRCEGSMTLPLDTILEFQGKLKKLTKSNLEKLKNNILKKGFTAPPFVWDDKGDYRILDGHQRLAALISLREDDYDIPMIPVALIHAENEKDAREILLQISSQYGEFDMDELETWLDECDSEVAETLRLVDKEIESIQKETKDPDEPTEGDDDLGGSAPEQITKPGDLWQLGPHRLLCGDSTDPEHIAKLMSGDLAVLGVNDPPYGMKKENDGVMNDNLNYEHLLEFNKKWISAQVAVLKDNGSFYCFGIDEPLMDIYSDIIKPLMRTQKATFRNLITWDKGHGQGQTAEGFRMYPVADEKILFIMMGVQGFNNNADNYFEGWEPIRDYLLQSRLEMGWDVPTMKRIVGHSDLSRDHWTSKSQFTFPTREVYEKLQAVAREQENKTAFSKEYDAFKKEYNAFKKEYDDLKAEYYGTRAYFDNTHDNMNNVWHFPRPSGEEKEMAGGHATPKPIDLMSRILKSSSREGDIVVDFFLGSGSTLITAEKTGRICYGMELSESWCDVIVNRYLLWCERNDREPEIKLNGEAFTR